MPGPILWGPNSVANNLQGAISLPDGTVLKRDGIENYIKNFNLDSGLTTGFATYANTAGPAPVTGTGGAPNSTIAAVAYTGFGGSTALQFVKGAANRQGEGFSYAFSIDADDQAKVLTIEAAYIVVSGTFAAAGVGTDSDMNVWIYDVTNATVIQPVNFELLTSSTTLTGQVKAQFQAASNSTSYRLIFHCATTSALAYTLNFGKFKVWPSPFTGYGVIQTDWVPYTPTYTGFGTVTSSAIYSRRNGPNLEIQGTFTTGTVTAATAAMTLGYAGANANVTIDTSVQAVGIAGTYAVATSTSTIANKTLLMVSGNNFLNFGFNSTTTPELGAQLATSVVLNTSSVAVKAVIPILGWSGQSQVISSYDGSIAAARITGATATITGTYSDVSFTTVANDSKAAYVAPNYTIPTSGYYDFSGSLNVSATTIAAGQLVTIGLFNTTTSTTLLETTYVYQGTNTTATAIPFVFNKVLLNAGTQIKIQVKASTTSPVITASATLNYWSIGLNSGAQQILAGQKIRAEYHLSANQAVTANVTAILFDAQDSNTGGIVNNSGVFSVQTAGDYTVHYTGSVGTSYFLLYKNGTLFRSLSFSGASAIASGSFIIPLTTTDTFEIRSSASTTAQGGAITVNGVCWIQIKQTN